MDKKVILVVDDVSNMRAAISRILKRNFNVLCLEAKDGLEALTKINMKLPDLVLLDIKMPEMDGVTVLRRIRNSMKNEVKKLPVVILTANKEKDEVKKVLRLEIQGYIIKPFSEIDVVSKVGSILEKKFY